jgi:WD40 repeat protein
VEGHSDRVLYIDFYPNGEQIATASQDGTARIWDVESGQDSQRLEGHGKGIVGGVYEGVLGFGYNPDGSRLVTAGADKTARIWDAATGQELIATGLTRAVFSPDGRFIATGSDFPDAIVRL